MARTLSIQPGDAADVQVPVRPPGDDRRPGGSPVPASDHPSKETGTATRRARMLAGCGVVAGPLFIVAALAQMPAGPAFTRPATP